MASQHPAADTPSERARRVVQLALLGVMAGVMTMVFLQLWRVTNNQFVLYIGIVAGVVTALAILTEFVIAVAPQLRQLRKFL
jgi:hypothetical protein